DTNQTCYRFASMKITKTILLSRSATLSTLTSFKSSVLDFYSNGYSFVFILTSPYF
ncbi:hypothetical protein COCCADRAFT_112539, partial [Bipolaris zeicola 26-R-13]